MNKYSKTKIFKKIFRFSVKFFLAIIIVFFLVFLFYTLNFIFLNGSDISNPKFTDGNLEMYMLDVGQAESILLLQNDKAMLVDTGCMYRPSEVEEYLDDIGVKKIDYLIITHPHQDHAGGLISIMAHIKVDKIIKTEISTNGWTFTENLFLHLHNIFLDYVNILSKNSLVKTYKDYPNETTFADASFYFLPFLNDKYSKINDYSLVMKVEYKDISILLTGDIHKARELELIESGENLLSDVYIAAHHGSKTSNSEVFLETVNPQYVLISCDNGNDNLYGHPVKEFMRYLEKKNIPVYRTDESGTIIMNTDGENIVFDSNQDDYKSGKELLNEKKKE